MMSITKEESKVLKALVEQELEHIKKDESMLHADNVVPDLLFLTNAKDYERLLQKILKKMK